MSIWDEDVERPKVAPIVDPIREAARLATLKPARSTAPASTATVTWTETIDHKDHKDGLPPRQTLHDDAAREQARQSAAGSMRLLKIKGGDKIELLSGNRVGGWYDGSVPKVSVVGGGQAFPRAPSIDFNDEVEFRAKWLTPFIAYFVEHGITVTERTVSR